MHSNELPFWREQLWQDGVVTRAQVLATGLTDSWIRARLESRLWQRLLPGVFLTNNGTPDHLARVWAAVLYAGDGAAASHQTAAFLHGLVGTAPDDTHVVVPSTRRVRPQPGLVVHRIATPSSDTAQRPPRTSVATTILDLAAAEGRIDAVVGLVTKAYALRIATPANVAAALSARQRQRWRPLLAEMVRDAEGLESALEWRYRRDVERRHGLPTPRRQVASRTNSSGYRRDVEYDEFGVIVELDGRQGHDGVGAFRDAARDNAALLAGRVTLRFGWWDVRCQPCLVALHVAAVLEARGWMGTPRACGPQCPIKTETTKR